ncbi:hypothetical protein H4Q26_005423 [Puccinia striiformis f. sp. tritici PST-130]|nr:hypothetical protein H4Q26_005423 [Puccinia striiformis f. sp. tritici PST-130]
MCTILFQIKEHQHTRNQSPQSQEKAKAIFSQPEPNSQEVHGQTHTDSDLLILVESINLYYDIVLKLTNCTIRISALSPWFSVHQVIQTQDSLQVLYQLNMMVPKPDSLRTLTTSVDMVKLARTVLGNSIDKLYVFADLGIVLGEGEKFDKRNVVPAASVGTKFLPLSPVLHEVPISNCITTRLCQAPTAASASILTLEPAYSPSVLSTPCLLQLVSFDVAV